MRGVGNHRDLLEPRPFFGAFGGFAQGFARLGKEGLERREKRFGKLILEVFFYEPHEEADLRRRGKKGEAFAGFERVGIGFT